MAGNTAPAFARASSQAVKAVTVAKKAPSQQRKDRLSDWRELIGNRHGASIKDQAKRYRSFLQRSQLRRPLEDACKYFGFDPRKTSHRNFLLLILADVCFHLPRRGRRKGTYKWSADRLLQLAEHFYELTAAQRRRGNAAEIIKDQFRDHYRYDSIETLRQRLTQAHRIRGNQLGLVPLDEMAKHYARR